MWNEVTAVVVSSEKAPVHIAGIRALRRPQKAV